MCIVTAWMPARYPQGKPHGKQAPHEYGHGLHRTADCQLWPVYRLGCVYVVYGVYRCATGTGIQSGEIRDLCVVPGAYVGNGGVCCQAVYSVGFVDNQVK